MHLIQDGHVATGDITLTTNIQDMQVVTSSNGSVFLYASTGANGGITAWRLDEGALPVAVDHVYFPPWMSAAVDGLGSLMGSGDQIAIGGDDASSLLSYGISNDGQITALEQSGDLISGTDRITAITSVVLGATNVVYIADQGTAQLVGYRENASGELTAIGNSARIATGPATVVEHTQAHNTDFLLAASSGDEGITSYRIGNTGALQEVGFAGADTGLGIATPTAMEVIQAYGQSFVLVGAAGSSSITVMRLDAQGALEVTDHRIDGLATRFDGITALAVAQHDDRVFVVAGGADDGLSLFTLLPDGRLVSLSTLAHETGAGLMNVQDIAVTMIGDTLRVLVTSATDAGISQYTADLSDLGAVVRGHDGTLNGTAGDDLIEAAGRSAAMNGGNGDDVLVAQQAGSTMTGGNGADTFVLSADAGTYHITDFQAAVDQLDISDFAMLRSVGQIGHEATASGARLTFRDTVIELTSSNGNPLTLEGIFDGGFDWADRIVPMPSSDPQPETQLEDSTPATPDDEINGSTGDSVDSGTGEYQLSGGAGNDLLEGGVNNDALNGNAGRDTLVGGTGDDTLRGGTGFDHLEGGAGNDFLHGGFGADTFIFSGIVNNDRIADFTPGTDHIAINGMGLDFESLDLSQACSDVVIALDSGKVTLVNTDLADLGTGDFWFK